ncbi:hypothetical protein ACFYOK_36020 [Microbispora bryophytorum]|uniref:hypothetical protein n=1 Tax=Microbispora bryophytorum TaxID=1460882 RepID=UPI0033FA7930
MPRVSPPTRAGKDSPERLPLRWAVIGIAATGIAVLAAPAGALAAIGAALGTAVALHRMIM